MPSREIRIDVQGRTLVGHCSGSAGDQPTVILESGNGGTQQQFAPIEAHLATRTQVCAYDRAGVGGSDPSPKTPRPVIHVLRDLESFLSAALVEPPYFLIGGSAGGVIVFMYAQQHPRDVAGFVTMNPMPPPYATWIGAARKVLSPGEVEALELPDYRGENPERIEFTANERMLTDGLPATMPYAVMFDEDCGGVYALCERILPPLTKVMSSLASVGSGGRFILAEGAGHDIYETKPKLVLDTIDATWAEAVP